MNVDPAPQRSVSVRAFIIAMVLAGAAAGCQATDEERAGSPSGEAVQPAAGELAPGFVAALDSGNVAYRRDDHEAALEHYERALRADDRGAAAWYGVYMVQHALGDTAAAEAALERAQSLAPVGDFMDPATDPVP